MTVSGQFIMITKIKNHAITLKQIKKPMNVINFVGTEMDTKSLNHIRLDGITLVFIKHGIRMDS